MVTFFFRVNLLFFNKWPLLVYCNVSGNFGQIHEGSDHVFLVAFSLAFYMSLHDPGLPVK